MVKGNPRSSATSATRKKHAKRQTAPEDPFQNLNPKGPGGKGGKKNKEPRVKIYIPPAKPAPLLPDPLETTGLAHTLPPELLVVLRNLSKKAQVTKVRALEDLQTLWVDECLNNRETTTVNILIEMLPVWLHHLPSLLINPSRRIRLISATLQSSLLKIHEIHEQFLFFLSETASSSQLENVLGALFLSSQDVDRSVAAVASKVWEMIVSTTSKTVEASSSSTRHIFLDDDTRSSLTSFIQRAALDPIGVYTSFNPVAPPAPTLVNHPYQSKRGSTKGSQASTPKWVDGGDETPRSKVDDQEESEVDRKARLRIGALGAIKWLLDVTASLSDDLKDIFLNIAFWTSLNPHETPTWVNFESFGFNQPNVRKSAWNLLQSVLKFPHDELDLLLPILSTVVLRSAWAEVDPIVQTNMWHPLLTFLRAYPQSWTLEWREGDNLENESGDEGPISQDNKKALEVYREFLQFLELGCSGSPIQGYPTVVVILSTIPLSLLLSTPGDDLPTFFTAFWAAVDGRALNSLNRKVSSAAFLSSLLECTVFLLKRINASKEEPRLNLDDGLVREIFSRVWVGLSSQKLQVVENTAAKLISQSLGALVDLDRSIFDSAWEPLAAEMKMSSGKSAAKLATALLKTLIEDASVQVESKQCLKANAEKLLKAISTDNIERIECWIRESSKEQVTNFDMMEEVLEEFKETLFLDQSLAVRWDDLLSEHAYKIFTLSPNLLLLYLSYRNDEVKCLLVWHSLLASIASSDNMKNVIKSLSEAVRNRKLPQYLRPRKDELDGIISTLLEEALASSKDSNDALLFKQILMDSGYFLSHLGYESSLDVVTSTFTSDVQLLLEGKEVQVSNLDVTLYFIEAIFSRILQHDNKVIRILLPVIFNLAYLLPLALPDSVTDVDAISPSQTVSKGLWETWLNETTDIERKDVFQEVVHNLREFMMDSNVYPLPIHLLRLISQHPPGLSVNLLEDIFPSRSQLDALLDELSPEPNDPSLTILNDLLPTSPHPSSKSKIKKPAFTDRHGFSPYARVVNGLSQAFIDDRQLAKHNLWALRHFLALSIYAQDLKNIPSSYQYASPLFDGKVSETKLEDVVMRVKQNSVYLFNFVNSSSETDREDGAWRCGVVERFFHATGGKDLSKEGLGDSQALLFDIVWHAKRRDTVRDVRVMKCVLESLLAGGTGNKEAELWVQFARKIEKSAPETSMAIISVLASLGAESPRLDRYRNELAASLHEIKPRNVNADGLLTLRKLTASAPNPESNIIFLPTHRSVNAIKALQSWVLTEVDDEEDEIGEDVESAMLPLFVQLAPMLQSVSGSHWPFMFDVLESGLDRVLEAEEDDQSSDVEQQQQEIVKKRIEYGVMRVALARALRFVVLMEDLTTRNKPLMEEWKERRTRVMKSILGLEILRSDAKFRTSTPVSVCRELALSILENLPQSSTLIDESTLSKMVHLLEDSSYKVQKISYRFLTTAAKKRTERLVIDAGVTTSENEAEYLLPLELLDILKKEVDLEGELDDEQVDVFGYLLGWMVVFDSFVDASFKVRSSYIDQLRTSNVVLETFIPCFLHLLGLDRGGPVKAFKLDIWGIDSFYPHLYQPGRTHSLPVFMAHVYYRALLTIPSLIYSWVLDCKDRQLMNAVTTYTSTYFSSILIKAELEHVRTSAASGELADDKMSIKVVSASGGAGGGGEVMASYLVDDHQLEIRIRIPSDWPLHRVEVKDVKRVGVDENRWRAWVLGVQQTIWAHNGRIVDGLMHFKKNVNLHFEGQVECAICYSIISVMDGSLPKKPCKTCRNRFHAGCLYKWFNTSHSSSCPLCRSDII